MNVTRTEAESDLVAACTNVTTARALLAAAIALKEGALTRMHTEDGRPKTRVAERARAVLREADWTDDEIATMGLSDGNVRLCLDRPRSLGS